MITDYLWLPLIASFFGKSQVVLHHRYPCPGPLFTPGILSPGASWATGFGYRSASCGILHNPKHRHKSTEATRFTDRCLYYTSVNVDLPDMWLTIGFRCDRWNLQFHVDPSIHRTSGAAAATNSRFTVVAPVLRSLAAGLASKIRRHH